jgi:nitrogen-specific signal transduction histidine kinase
MNMQHAYKPARIVRECAALIGTPNAQLARRISYELKRGAEERTVRVAPTLTQLLERFTESAASVTFIDDQIVEGKRLAEFVKQLTGSAPVVLLADPGRECEVLKFIADDKLDFVARVADFAPLVVSVLQCRLRNATFGASSLRNPDEDSTVELAEIFRHEINNPLTGILGNAELLLAHGAHLNSVDVQRVQTVVELAVRLRETIRRVSDVIGSNPRVIPSI